MGRSIILTDWSADTEYLTPSNSARQLVWELVLLSLLYDTIYIQDEVLALSEKLPNFFVPEHEANNFGHQVDPLSELFATGALKVLGFPTSAYPREELREKALRSPIRARSEYLQRYSTKGAEIFTPSQLQDLFYSHIDRELNKYPSCIEQIERDRESLYSPLAQKLTQVLSDERYLPWINSAIGGISAPARKQLLSFIAEPERAEKAMYKAGVRRTRLLNRGSGVTRSLFYRAATTLFPSEQAQIKRLVQSVFAADLCSRKCSAGRYSKALQELLVIPSDAELYASKSNIPTVTVGPCIEQVIKLPDLASGFAEVICEIRESKPGIRLRESTARAGTEVDFSDQKEAWTAVAEMLATRIDRGKQVRLRHVLLELPPKVGEALVGVSILEGLYESAVTGATLQSLTSVGLKALAHGVLGLSATAIFRWCAYHYAHQELRERIQDAVAFRCGDVPFFA